MCSINGVDFTTALMNPVRRGELENLRRATAEFEDTVATVQAGYKTLFAEIDETMTELKALDRLFESRERNRRLAKVYDLRK